jgi:hypothetical protein
MAPLTDSQIAGLVVGIAVYLTLNITGTVYYTKLEETQPVEVSDSLMGWNLASVILGWLGLPLLNLSSSITYGVYADEIEARNAVKDGM